MLRGIVIDRYYHSKLFSNPEIGFLELFYFDAKTYRQRRVCLPLKLEAWAISPAALALR